MTFGPYNRDWYAMQIKYAIKEQIADAYIVDNTEWSVNVNTD